MTAELSDAEVFGQQGEMSDEEVFGRSRESDVSAVDTDSFGPPQAWLDRVRNGQMLKRVIDRTASGAVEGLGNEPLGLSDEHLRQLQDLGIFHNPHTGKPGYVGVLGEAGIDAVANGLDSIMRLVSSGVHGAGGAFGQIVQEITDSETQGTKAEREAINLGNFLMVDSGMGHYSRPNISRDNIIHSQPIGGLPTEADFHNAANVIAPARLTTPVRAERDLRQLWWERGILPSEAVQRTEFAALAKEPVGHIIAWHGTPHDFEAFDFSKIGTGEGAQAYGYGGYFAEARAVGEEYQQKLSDMGLTGSMAKKYLARANGDVQAAIETMKTHAEAYRDRGERDVASTLEDATKLLESGWTKPTGVLYRVRINADPEQFYDLDKPLNEQNGPVREAMNKAFEGVYPELEWRTGTAGDWRLVKTGAEDTASSWGNIIKVREGYSAQSDAFSEVFPTLEAAKKSIENYSRNSFMRMHMTMPDTQAAAAQAMRAVGLHGIKYLDEGSRASNFFVEDEAANTAGPASRQGPFYAMHSDTQARQAGPFDTREEAQKWIADKDKEQQTRNYVVFDDQAVQITHKNDVPMENLREMWHDRGIHPAEAAHDAQSDAFLRDEIANPAGADVTRPENLPTMEQQPPPPPGSLVAALRSVKEKLFDVGRDIQMMTTPMVTGSKQAMALAKDFANAMRRNRWEWSRVDQDIARRFTPEQRKRMWDAADEESVARQLGESTEHQGLVTLTDEERAAVEDLQARAQFAWAHARDLGMVEGEGLPAYTPRMVLNVAEAGGDQRALPLNAIGQNLRTRTSQMLHREHMMAEETEAAARERVRASMAAAGKSEEEITAALEKVQIARDIRSLPLATAKLEDAISGRTLINAIQDAGRATGDDTVSIGSNPGKGWFTIDHPAFYRWQPKYKDGAVVKDVDGNTVFERAPIYVRGDFEGPLQSVLTKPNGATYQALMSLKGKTMGLIMNSPLIHNAVEWGRALPAMPGKVMTFRVYREGFRAKNDIPTMKEAIDGGLVPIGHRFFNQDISSIMEEPNLQPGRSWTAQVLGFVPGLFDPEAGTAVKAAIDKAGDFWHNTLLWDRVGDLQMGLYVNFRDGLLQKDVDRQTAARAAAHWANRYAGALPTEAMSDGARKLSNLLLFSRSFTLGNIGAMKDMLTGLPKDVMAQIERDGGTLDPKAIRSIAVRKAVAIVTLDMGLMYIGNSLLQNGMNVLTQDSTLDEEMHGYAQRMADELRAVKEHPLKLLQPLSVVGSLSATAENEPGRDERIRVGYAADGTAIYARNPAGKIGEEFTGYLSGPLDMIRRKLGTIARPVWQIMANDKGFGRKVYDPNADAPEKYLANMGAIAKLLAESQLPEGQIGAFMDLVKGEGDAKVNALQAFGPIAGVTFSKGTPGGPAIGELYHAREMHDYAVQAQLPDIRKQIQRGDVQGARDRMTELGVPAGLQRYYIRTSQNPSLRLSPKALRDFYLYGTPEQKQRMEQLR